jgi:hypothetical protein
MKLSTQGLAKRHHNALMKWMADATLLADIDDVLDASIDNQLTAKETMAAVRDITWRAATICKEWKNIAYLQYVQGRVSA